MKKIIPILFLTLFAQVAMAVDCKEFTQKIDEYPEKELYAQAEVCRAQYLKALKTQMLDERAKSDENSCSIVSLNGEIYSFFESTRHLDMKTPNDETTQAVLDFVYAMFKERDSKLCPDYVFIEGQMNEFKLEYSEFKMQNMDV